MAWSRPDLTRMPYVVLDTDTTSQYRKGRLPTAVADLVRRNVVHISFVTVGELHKWALLWNWGPVRLGGMELWLDEVPILPYGSGVARAWGRLAARAQRRGRRRPDNDTWIAACCIESGLPLVTFNRRDFADFAVHDGLVLL
jgi:predicted nucleic acid-binding protein